MLEVGVRGTQPEACICRAQYLFCLGCETGGSVPVIWYRFTVYLQDSCRKLTIIERIK